MLTEEEKQCPHFQQDNIVACTSQHSVESFCEIFGERIINQGFLPPHLPDLSLCIFYIWGNLKQKVYRNSLHTLEALQN
jgi:hypothetical protein